MSQDRRSCSTCRHYFPFEARGKPLAHCRLNGPTISPADGSTIWPLVQPTYSCGQWSESPKARSAREHSKDCRCSECIMRLPCSQRWNALGPVQRAYLERADPKEAAALKRAAGVS